MKNGFSIIAPIDTNRLEQFAVTKRVYDTFPQNKEFIMPTRSMDEVSDYLYQHKLMRDVVLISYSHEIGFNPAKALNIGVRNAQYGSVIITSPEVKPKTQVLEQLQDCLGCNIICRVWDEDDSGKVVACLVQSGYRDDTPAMYFLAMLNKADILAINGWDEKFMDGYAYEDNDFGNRWRRAGIPFAVRDDIEAVHQYHPRLETIPGGITTNFNHLAENDNSEVIRCKKGIKQRKRKVV